VDEMDEKKIIRTVRKIMSEIVNNDPEKFLNIFEGGKLSSRIGQIILENGPCNHLRKSGEELQNLKFSLLSQGYAFM